MALSEQRTINLSGSITEDTTGESLGFVSINMDLDYSSVSFAININNKQEQYQQIIQEGVIDFLNNAFAQGRAMGWQCLDFRLEKNEENKGDENLDG